MDLERSVMIMTNQSFLSNDEIVKLTGLRGSIMAIMRRIDSSSYQKFEQTEDQLGNCRSKDGQEMTGKIVFNKATHCSLMVISGYLCSRYKS
jgi:hypothetical protein